MAAHIRRRPFLAALVAVLLIAVLVLGGRAAWRLGVRLLGPPPPPRQVDVALIADWMSVPYVGRAYRVPQREIWQALGVEPEGRQRRPLRDIASETGRSTDETLLLVRGTVQAWQDSHPEPPPPPDAPSPPPMLPEEKPGNGRPGGDGKPSEGKPADGKPGGDLPSRRLSTASWPAPRPAVSQHSVSRMACATVHDDPA
ncbi:MAG: hypothetical protein IT306_01210 [Chloroflexi bacterium]|nr:hypothetical protein [Chloroflexota bacterium]